MLVVLHSLEHLEHLERLLAFRRNVGPALTAAVDNILYRAGVLFALRAREVGPSMGHLHLEALCFFPRALWREESQLHSWLTGVVIQAASEHRVGLLLRTQL